jgi:hypothetical protein
MNHSANFFFSDIISSNLNTDSISDLLEGQVLVIVIDSKRLQLRLDFNIYGISYFSLVCVDLIDKYSNRVSKVFVEVASRQQTLFNYIEIDT